MGDHCRPRGSGESSIVNDVSQTTLFDYVFFAIAITIAVAIIISSSPRSVVHICIENELMLIEDACMGIGAFINGRSAGSFGIVNAFSMHPLKSLNVIGDGGMTVTNDDKLAIWMRKYRNHGMQDRDNIEFWGVNMRLQPLQAVVAKICLSKLSSNLK